jgi:hypothetical protein
MSILVRKIVEEGAVVTEPKRIHPNCDECVGLHHHFVVTDVYESVGAPDLICKHCEFGYAWLCCGCDKEPINEPDILCANCTDWSNET